MIRLVNMPFGSLIRPALALGQIKAQLAEAGMESRTLNPNFDFARLIGFGAYECVSLFKGVETQVSEWLFAEAAWRRPCGPTEQEFLDLCGEELSTILKVPDPAAWLRKIKHEVVDLFLDLTCRRVVEGGVPRVVGFSCMFFQTLPALALGRLLKERYPEIKLAYGGACFHGEMGEELFHKVPWIDAVSTGEADDVLVPLFRALTMGEVPGGLQGILARDARGATVAGPPASPVPAEVLEALPDPDFDDFFVDAARFKLTTEPSWRERVTLPFEASRGCWWGQKKHCTFCGLNAEGMAFRAKSPERVHATMQRLSARYPIRNLQATDNILAMGAWKTLLPWLSEERLTSDGRPVDIFFEIKANLTRPQIKALADAGITYVQPGIESLSTPLLDQMGKGVTALQNVHLLKCCTEYGIVAYWNLLIRVPGERLEDYRQMEAWIPRLTHLRPPSGGAPRIECHRFSPYHAKKGVWTEDVRAARWYAGLFPADTFDLDKVAYYFDATWKDTLGDPHYDGLLQKNLEWMRRWREQPDPPRLAMRDVEGGGMEIEDTRGGGPAVIALDPRQAALYRAIADIATPRRARALLPEALGDAMSEAAVRGALRAFVEQGLALEEEDRFLGLALPPTAGAVPLERRRVQMRRIANQAPHAAHAGKARLPIIAR
ncbi:MAG: RiPP maturation radical SAM C-methyltransferase [Minicystis sp.]